MMPGPLPKPEGRRQRRNKRRVIVLERAPACVVCGEHPAPLCSRRCARRLDELGGAAKQARECERAASRAASPADAKGWRDLAAQLRQLASEAAGRDPRRDDDEDDLDVADDPDDDPVWDSGR